MLKFLFTFTFICFPFVITQESKLPLIINTWKFSEATEKAFQVLSSGSSALDALVAGCSRCEDLQCDGTVGPGSADENGETTLDALIMDGETLNVGAVANLRQIKNAIGVAKYVLLYTDHTILSGNQATDFAVSMGFKTESLSTEHSKEMWKKWRYSNCQPNFWRSVTPNSKYSCGPYKPTKDNTNFCERAKYKINDKNHDTIGMIIIDENQHIYAGTSTNGAKFKIPGRVGDSPIPGAGAYAENGVGAAAATGDGDVMLRFLPSFVAVENLRKGMTPQNAAKDAIKRILKYYPDFSGGLIVARYNGDYAAACAGMKEFPFSVHKNGKTEIKIDQVECEKQ